MEIEKNRFVKKVGNFAARGRIEVLREIFVIQRRGRLGVGIDFWVITVAKHSWVVICGRVDYGWLRGA
jgi:hypothetical protein